MPTWCHGEGGASRTSQRRGAFGERFLLPGPFSFAGLGRCEQHLLPLAGSQGWCSCGCLEHQLLSTSSGLLENFHSSIFSWLWS